MTENGFVFRTRLRNRLAGFVVTEWPIEHYPPHGGTSMVEEPAGEET
jgi:hypothetical protein